MSVVPNQQSPTFLRVMPKAKLYSYVRFSSKEQSKGDSLNRQTEMAKRYADEHGYILDTSLDLHDKGISGFKGANRAKGRLGDFLRMVEAGQITGGSALFIEALDRYSRSNPIEALLELFQCLIRHGITIITGSDGQVYDKESFEGFNGAITGMRMLLALGVANQESAQKSQRLRAVSRTKRQKTQETGAAYNKRGPFWVTYNIKKSAFELNSQAETVRLIFKLYAEGLGGNQIANHLNQSGIRSAQGKFWDSRVIIRLIKDRKVLGELQLHSTTGDTIRKNIPEGPPIKNYYPKCITNDLFLEVNRINKERPKGCGKTSSKFVDLFERIVFCGNTGVRLKKHNYGCGRYYKRKIGGSSSGFTGWKISTVEKCFFYLSSNFDFDSIARFNSSRENKSEIDEIEIELGRLRIISNNLINAIELGGEIERIKNKYDENEIKIKNLELKRDKIKGDTIQEGSRIINKKGVNYYYDLYLKRDESKENRLMLRRIIKEEVEKVLLFPDGIKTDLFLNKDQKHLVGIKYPVVGIISRNVNFSCFLAFRSKRGEPVPIAINGTISLRNTEELLDKASNRIIA